MNILWQYPYPDCVFKSHGSTLNKTYSDSLRHESVEFVMAKWDWDKLVWGKVRRLVFNLQKRIYKATKSGMYSKAKSLMYLLHRPFLLNCPQLHYFKIQTHLY
ncbi:hypothetical protein THIOM_002412 [Candidatus Thiomargarita nelsonii]|uniref:Reverse transcriptase N-terminal domain-containing protein n=1 Tax=Candidatus Thiomargarita nelsonii TaxID=1003181 RepID=A0A176S1L2_9GAMM|nr:hypothetical protein THIOM_002412 [Candidatus Thiomargarita nelsonii]